MAGVGRIACLAASLALGAAMACAGESARGVDPERDTVVRLTSTSAGAVGSRIVLDSLTAAGEERYRAGEYDSARTRLQTALEAASSLGDSAAVARLLTSLGLAAWRLGEYPDARRLGTTALAIKHRHRLRADLFRSYNALGLLARSEGAFEASQTWFDSALAMARELGNRVDVAKVTANRALNAADLGDLAAARAGAAAARDSARAASDTLTEWNATVNLASVEMRLRNPLAVIADVEDLRRRYPAIGHPVGEDNALGQLATAYTYLGEYQRAIAALDSALRIVRRAGLTEQEAENLKLLAEIYEATGDRRRALAVLDSAARVDSAIGAADELADVLRRRAAVLGALGDAARARASVARALALHRDMRAPTDILEDLLVDAELASRSGDPAGARARLDEARSIAARLGDPAARSAVALTTARIADNVADASGVLQALAIPRADLAAGGVAAELEADALAARAHRRLGQLDMAISRGRSAVAGLERVRTSLGLGELRTTFVTDKAAVYTDLVLSLLQVGRTREALEVADGARSRALLDHIAEARLQVHDTVSSAALSAERARVLRRIDALMRRLSAAGEGRSRERSASTVDAATDIVTELAAARREFDELLIRGPTRASNAPRVAPIRMNVDSVQRALRDDEALLEYFVTSERTLIFVARRDGVRVFTSALGGNDLGGRVRLARDLLAQPGGAASKPASAGAVLLGLYRALIEPAVLAGALADVRRLIVVPHAALAYLPFAALRSPSGRALAEQYAVLYLPVAAALPALRASEPRASGAKAAPRLAALAPFPATLTSTRAEARRAADARAGSLVLVGARATEHAMREELKAGAIVHLASHGVMESESPMFSHIALAGGTGAESDNGRLEVHEVLSLSVASPLVFLSGCETGVGEAWSSRYLRTADHATLEQAFLYAGARTVVATRWRVEDESAAAFAGRFYAHLASGTADAADAVALAQRDLMRSPRFAAPHFWAAYAVSGAGPVPMSAPQRQP
jgi:tetratricopeptide (TPR) repeat protein